MGTLKQLYKNDQSLFNIDPFTTRMLLKDIGKTNIYIVHDIHSLMITVSLNQINLVSVHWIYVFIN